MAIDTINKKLALIEYGDVYQPGIPVSDDGLDQADNQQLLWEYPGTLWEEIVVKAITVISPVTIVANFKTLVVIQIDIYSPVTIVANFKTRVA